MIYVAYAASRWERVGQLATVVAWLGLATNAGALAARGVAAGRVPYVTQYEYLTAFAWAVAAVYLVFEWRFAGERRGCGMLCLFA